MKISLGQVKLKLNIKAVLMQEVLEITWSEPLFMKRKVNQMALMETPSCPIQLVKALNTITMLFAHPTPSVPVRTLFLVRTFPRECLKSLSSRLQMQRKVPVIQSIRSLVSLSFQNHLSVMEPIPQSQFLHTKHSTNVLINSAIRLSLIGRWSHKPLSTRCKLCRKSMKKYKNDVKR